MHLNHFHFSVPDVPATASFFTDYFNFRLREIRGHNGFAVLDGEKGVVLALMRSPSSTVESENPFGDLHVGFLLADEAAVRSVHARLAARSRAPSELQFMRGSLRFYCRAPGGMLVEVGHEPGP